MWQLFCFWSPTGTARKFHRSISAVDPCAVKSSVSRTIVFLFVNSSSGQTLAICGFLNSQIIFLGSALLECAKIRPTRKIGAVTWRFIRGSYENQASKKILEESPSRKSDSANRFFQHFRVVGKFNTLSTRASNTRCSRTWAIVKVRLLGEEHYPNK